MTRIAAAVCLSLALITAPAHAAGKRMALVVGIDTYRNVTPLTRARNDAKTIGQTLRDAGYEVTELLDPGRLALQRAIREHARNASDGDESVFFFAGHGIQAGSENFLLAADVLVRDEGELRDEGVALNSAIERLAEARVRFSLLIIDACRDNPLPRVVGRSVGGSRGLAAPVAGRGQAIIYSAGTGQQAIDRLSDADTDPNGLFTRVFAKEMRRPGVSVRQVLQDVRSEVDRLAKSVRHEQYPALYDEMRGDFYFFPGTAGLAAVPAPAAGAATGGGVVITDNEVEREAWNLVKDSSRIEDVKGFMIRFPAGRLKDVASLKLQQLELAGSVNPIVKSEPTPWAAYQAQLEPGLTRSPNVAELPPDVRVVPPRPDVPESVRGLSGRWVGWAGRDARASLAIAVEEMSGLTALVSLSYADADTPSRSTRIRLSVVNENELKGSTGDGHILALRQRTDGHMDVLITDPPGKPSTPRVWIAGVATRLSR